MITLLKHSTFQSKTSLTLFMTYCIFYLFIYFALYYPDLYVLFYFPLKYLTKVTQALDTIRLCNPSLLPVIGSFKQPVVKIQSQTI